MISNEEHVARNRLRRQKNKPLRRVYASKFKLDTPEQRGKANKFNTKKAHAKKLGIPFNILFDELHFPSICPVLGIPLCYLKGSSKGHKRDSPSFDRIDPTKGYVKGNVIVVSQRANAIKSDATPTEILLVGNYYKQLLSDIKQ